MSTIRSRRDLCARTPRRLVSLILAAGAAISAAAVAGHANAQFVWVKPDTAGVISGATPTYNSTYGTFTSTFSTAGNWLGTAPVAADAASGAATLTFRLTNVGQVTATQDVASIFQVAGMTFDIRSSNAFILAGSAGNKFQMVGVNPTITLTGNSLGTPQIGASANASGSEVNLNASPDPMNSNARTTIINGSGLGNLLINGTITEAVAGNSLTISGGATSQNSRVVSLAGTNTFTGGVILDGGNLNLVSATGLGTGQFRVTSNGGVCSGTATLTATTATSVQLDGQLRYTNGTLTLNTATDLLSGAGALLLNNASLTVKSNSSGYTGTITADLPQMPNNFGGSAGTVTLQDVSGALPNVSTYNLRAGASLVLNNGVASVAGVNTDRVKDTAAINLASGFLRLQGGASTTTVKIDATETVGAVTGNGFSTIGAEVGTDLTTKTVLTMASLNRGSDRGTFLLRGINLGAGTANSGNINITSAPTGLVGGGGDISNATDKAVSILPYAIGGLFNTSGVASSTSLGDTFVTMSGTSVKPLATTQYAADLVSPDNNNVRLNANVTNNATKTINSLLLSANSTTSDGAVTGTGTLNITSGALLCNSQNNNKAATTDFGTGTVIRNNIHFGNGISMDPGDNVEAQIYTPGTGASTNYNATLLSSFCGTLNISGNMTGTGGLTKSGAPSSGGGVLNLTGNNTGLTGQLTLNAGVIMFNSANALPGGTSGSDLIVSNGTGTSLTGPGTGIYYVGTDPINISRPIHTDSGVFGIRTLNNSTPIANTPNNLTLSGQISGPGALNLVGAFGSGGTTNDTSIIITRTDNTYTGGTNLGGGGVHIAGDGSLGDASGAVQFTSGTLVLDNDWTTNRQLNFSGTASIDTGNHNATLNGPLTGWVSGSAASNGANSGFNKFGTGTLSITGNASTVGGTMTVAQGTMLVNGRFGVRGGATSWLRVGGDPGSFVGTGTLGGTGIIDRNIEVNSSGVLSPGSSPGVLTVNGNLLMGNSSHFKVEINGSAPGSGYDQLVVNGTVGLNIINNEFLGTAGSSLPLLDLSLGFNHLDSDKYFILVNDGTDAITDGAQISPGASTFQGMANGSSVFLGNENWGYGPVPIFATISYFGDFGSGAVTGGNDVVLYNVTPAPGAATLLGLGGLLAARRRRR